MMERMLRGACALLALIAFASPAGAQLPDAKPVRIVVPAPPGGNLDAGARLIAQKLTALTGEPHVVDNRPGAGTQIGVEYVIRSPADGRTLLYGSTFTALLPLLQKVSFSPMAELAPVIQLTTDEYALAANPQLALGSARDLPKLAESRTGGLNCAAYPGNSTIACEQLKVRLGGRVTVVPFAGAGPALNSVLGGHADILFVNTEPVQRLVQSGRLRVLAQSRGGPLQAPAFGDLWPGFVIEGHGGILVPAATPPEKIRQLNQDLNKVLADPSVIAVMQEAGQEPVGGPPGRYADAIRRSYERYAEVIRQFGLGPR